MPLRGRRLARWLGWLAVGLAFTFVATRLAQGDAWDLVRPQLAPLLLATLAGALLYGLGGLFLSSAWRQILALEHPPGPALGYHAVYGRTQIAKYLPGNCFHFVGRQMLGRTLGHSQAALALASLLEAALLLALASSLAAPLARPWLGDGAWLLPVVPAAALALLWRGAWLVPARWWPLPQAGGGRALLPPPRLLEALACYGLFFALAAGLLWLQATLLGAGRGAAPGLPGCLSGLALAWAAGFVMPGSSAGLGVREAVLIVALEGTLGAEASGVLALAFRLLTTVGDGVFCLLALALPLPQRSSEVKN
jgi:glycosyltransferase 2 family protein